MDVVIAAMVFSLLTLIAVLFQIALAAGAPWGELTLGGQFTGRLPGMMRGVAVLQAAILLFIAAVVLARAGLLFSGLQSIAGIGIWVVVGFCALNTLMNLVTPSQRERRLWAPVTAIMLLCSLIIALSGP